MRHLQRSRGNEMTATDSKPLDLAQFEGRAADNHSGDTFYFALLAECKRQRDTIDLMTGQILALRESQDRQREQIISLRAELLEAQEIANARSEQIKALREALEGLLNLGPAEGCFHFLACIFATHSQMARLRSVEAVISHPLTVPRTFQITSTGSSPLKSADETTYKSYGRMAEDQAAYLAWKRTEFKPTCERIRQLWAL